jgi:hypothetical protein
MEIKELKELAAGRIRRIMLINPIESNKKGRP